MKRYNKKSVSVYGYIRRRAKKELECQTYFAKADWCDTKTRPGFLRLIAGESLQSTFGHHLLAIRQTDFTFDAETAFEYTPNNFNQMAGLVLYLNESNYIYCYVTWDENKGKCLRMIESENGVAQIEEWRIPLTEKKTS